MKNKTCCFIGQNDFIEDRSDRKKIYKVIKNLIKKEKVDTFLFGIGSNFEILCYLEVSKLKKRFRKIRRAYATADESEILENSKKHLLQYYEVIYPTDKRHGSNKNISVYFDLIDRSEVCVLCIKQNLTDSNFAENTAKMRANSELKSALNYLKLKDKKIINISKI